MDWHPEDIKAAVRKRGSSLAALARQGGISTQALSLTLQARVSEKCELIISDFLNIHPSEIWPSRYRDDGTRMGSGRRSAAA
ncbi:helix-turn-helix transcriptional regulator [Sphingobium aromaticiconvertens]|uniref:helix-turn-helix domain-containing protein n=1 Tax=Sphingobium aromaticiconvertens TaxID=365341 RepID=UPI00301A4915